MHHSPTDPSGGGRYAAWLLVALVSAGLGVAAGTLSPAPAAAQDEDMAEAKQQFLEGKKLYQQGDYEKAADRFLKAYDLSKRSELLYNIGQAYRKAGKLRKAEKYFQKYLNDNPNPENEDAVVNRVIEIQQKLAARMATVNVKTETEGRKVFVDDEEEPRCTTPCSVSVDPGRYTFEVAGEGMQPWSKELSLERAAEQTLEVSLEPERTTGRLHVRTDTNGGTITVPNVGERSLPLSEPIELEVGDRELTVRSPAGGTWTGTVTIEEGETTRLMVPLGSAGSPSVRRSAAFGLVGTSAALFVGGALVGQSAKQTHSLLVAQQRRAGRVDPELLREGRREQTAANVLLGAGAGALLTGVGLFTWDLIAADR